MGSHDHIVALYRTSSIVTFSILCGGIFVCYADQMILGSFLPGVLSSNGVSPAHIGILFFCFAFAQGLMSLFAGSIIQRVGPEVAHSVSLFILGVTQIAFACSPVDTIWFLGLWRLIMGAAGSFVLNSSYVIVSRVYPNDISSRVAFLEVFIGVAAISAELMGGFLFEHYGWWCVFGSLTFISLLVAAGSFHAFWLILFAKKDTQSDSSDLEAAASRDTDTRPLCTLFDLAGRFDCLVVAMVAGVSTGAFSFYDPTMAPHLQNSFGPVTESTIGLVLAWIALWYTIVTIGAGLAIGHSEEHPAEDEEEEEGSADLGQRANKNVRWAPGSYHFAAVAGLGLIIVGFLIVGPSKLIPRVLTNAIFPGGIGPHTKGGWGMTLIGSCLTASGNALAFVPTVAWGQMVADRELKGLRGVQEQAVGLVVGAMALGEAMAPLLSGWAMGEFGFATTAEGMSLVTAVMCVLAVANWMRERSKEDAYLRNLEESAQLIKHEILDGDQKSLSLSSEAPLLHPVQGQVVVSATASMLQASIVVKEETAASSFAETSIALKETSGLWGAISSCIVSTRPPPLPLVEIPTLDTPLLLEDPSTPKDLSLPPLLPGFEAAAASFEHFDASRQADDVCSPPGRSRFNPKKEDSELDTADDDNEMSEPPATPMLEEV